MKTNKIPKIIIIVCVPIIIVFAVLIFNKNGIHDPYSHEEVEKAIMDPMLDTSKPMSVRLFEKYYYGSNNDSGPTAFKMTIVLKPEILDAVDFEAYRNDTAFVFTLYDDSLSKFETPMYVVKINDQAAFINALSRNDTLIFKRFRKFAWLFCEIR